MPLRCLITAGPTREYIDAVRYLSNGSSGKMGYALAAAAKTRGWTVDLVSGPVSLPSPAGVILHRVVSADEMYAACVPLFEGCDVFIAVAAVADFRPRTRQPGKIKKKDASLHLELEPTIDILSAMSARRTRQVVVGFAAEATDVENYARRKMAEKRLDWIVANDISSPDVGMEADNNTVLILGANGERVSFGPEPKTRVAEHILETVLGRA